MIGAFAIAFPVALGLAFLVSALVELGLRWNRERLCRACRDHAEEVLLLKRELTKTRFERDGFAAVIEAGKARVRARRRRDAKAKREAVRRARGDR